MRGWLLKARLDLGVQDMGCNETLQPVPQRNVEAGPHTTGSRRKLTTSGQGEVQWEGGAWLWMTGG